MPEFTGRLRTPRLPSAPGSPVVGELYYDTAGNALYYWNGTAWVSGGGGTTDVHVGAAAPSPRADQLLWVDTDAVGPVAMGGPLVTSLPAQPVDGQECYYVADATSGVVWHLIYRAADLSVYKWQFVGGPPIVLTAANMNLTSPGGSFYAGSPVLSWTAVLGGDYIAQHSAQLGKPAGWGSFEIACGLSVAGAAPAYTTEFIVIFDSDTAAAQGYPGSCQARVTVAAGQVLDQRFGHAAGNGTARTRVLSVVPARVG